MILKVLLLVGLVAHYSTAKSVHLQRKDSADRRAEDERKQEDHQPHLSEVIREVENLRGTFLRNFSEEMKRIDSKLQKIKDRHQHEMREAERAGQIQKPVTMRLEVSVPEGGKKVFELVADGDSTERKEGTLRISVEREKEEGSSESSESSQSNESDEGREKERAKEAAERRVEEEYQESRERKEEEEESSAERREESAERKVEEEAKESRERNDDEESSAERREKEKAKKAAEQKVEEEFRGFEERKEEEQSSGEGREKERAEEPAERRLEDEARESLERKAEEEESSAERREKERAKESAERLVEEEATKVPEHQNEEEESSTERREKEKAKELRELKYEEEAKELRELKDEEESSAERREKEKARELAEQKVEQKFQRLEERKEEEKESSAEKSDLMTAPSGSSIVISVPPELHHEGKVNIEVLPGQGQQYIEDSSDLRAEGNFPTEEFQTPESLATGRPMVELIPTEQPTEKSTVTIEATIPATTEEEKPTTPELHRGKPTTERHRERSTTTEAAAASLSEEEEEEEDDNLQPIVLPSGTTNIIFNLPSSSRNQGVDKLSQDNTENLKINLSGQEKLLRRPADGKRRTSGRHCPGGQDCNRGTSYGSYSWSGFPPQISFNQNIPFINLFGLRK